VTSPRVVPAVHWPLVELLFEPGAGDDLATLVRALADVCRPTAPDHTVAAAARLLSSPFAPESYLLQREPRLPYAVVVRTGDEVEHPVSAAAACLITCSEEAAVAAGVRGVALSPYARRCRQHLPVPPSARQRLRHANGLPEPLIVTVGRPGARPLGASSLATALRLASVVDVSGPHAVDAMALATPVVTDAATAHLLGAEHEVHVIVADPSSSTEAAADLATDPVRCATLGRAGRQLVEQRHDADRTARLVVECLGLPLPSATPAAPGLRLGDRLAELGTPAGHAIELQLADRLADLGVAPRTAGSIR
jgi:hypothetical protein